jgi:hypothetical protein
LGLLILKALLGFKRGRRVTPCWNEFRVFGQGFGQGYVIVFAGIIDLRLFVGNVIYESVRDHVHLGLPD